MENEMLSVASALMLAIAGALGHYIVSFLRGPDHVKDHAAILTLIDEVLSSGRWRSREGRMVLEEACGQLYARVISIRELQILMRCDAPSRAIRTYLKFRVFLEENESRRVFRFRADSIPFKRVFGIPLPINPVKYVVFYGLFAVLAMYGADILLGHRMTILDGVTIASKINLICAWSVVMTFALLAVAMVVRMLRLLEAEKAVLTDLRGAFQPTR